MYCTGQVLRSGTFFTSQTCTYICNFTMGVTSKLLNVGLKVWAKHQFEEDNYKGKQSTTEVIMTCLPNIRQPQNNDLG